MMSQSLREKRRVHGASIRFLITVMPITCRVANGFFWFSMKAKPTFISLFSGCGGMDAGFIKANFRCLSAFDIDKKAVEVHNKNLGNSAQLVDLQFVDIPSLLSRGRPDVVVAGSPCQGFSTAGRRDFHDPRNSLLLRAGEIAVKVQPQVFIAENVSGALAGDHKQYWFNLDSMLRSQGYKTKTLYLNASDLGLAQRRARIIMLAWKAERDAPLLMPSKNEATLKSVLAGIEDEMPGQLQREILSEKQKLIAQRIKPGQKLCDVRRSSSAIHTWDIPEVFGSTTEKEKKLLETVLVLRRRDRKRDWGDADPISIGALSNELGFASSSSVMDLIKKGYMRRVGRNVDLAHTFNGLYKRLSWDSVSPTVDTKFGNPRFFLHPSEDRGFTVREAARIQGFPDWFTFLDGARDSFRMIGNAVPPPMGECIANGVRSLCKLDCEGRSLGMRDGRRKYF